MKLRNIVFATLVGAGSLQASIVQGSSGLSSFTFQQDFSGNATTGPLGPSATLPLQQSLLTNPSASLFQFVSLTSSNSTSLYYDPNGSNGCAQGNGVNAMAPLAACIGDYVESNTSQNQTSSQAIPSNATFSILFGVPVYQASFALATAGSTVTNNTIITLHLTGGTTEVDPIHTNLLPSQEFVTVSNGLGITSIDISEGSGVAGSPYTWNAIIGDVEGTSAPEPGTMGLLGLGIAGVACFARRRKAA
jgi:PEP-CTERM motif